MYSCWNFLFFCLAFSHLCKNDWPGKNTLASVQLKQFRYPMAGKVKLFVLTAVLCSATLSCCAAGSDTLYVSPNPFSAQTVIHFELAGNDTVSLYVYNYVGAKVQTLYENTFLQSGPYSVGFAADSVVRECHQRTGAAPDL